MSGPPPTGTKDGPFSSGCLYQLGPKLKKKLQLHTPRTPPILIYSLPSSSTTPPLDPQLSSIHSSSRSRPSPRQLPSALPSPRSPPPLPGPLHGARWVAAGSGLRPDDGVWHAMSTGGGIKRREGVERMGGEGSRWDGGGGQQGGRRRADGRAAAGGKLRRVAGGGSARFFLFSFFLFIFENL